MFLNQAKSKSWAGPKIIAVVWLGEVEKNHRWPIQGSSEYHHVPKDTPRDKNGKKWKQRPSSLEKSEIIKNDANKLHLWVGWAALT